MIYILGYRLSALAVAGCGLAVISARAAEPAPTIDSNAYCNITAELVDGDTFKQQCLDKEATAERHIRALWAEAPDSVRDACVKNAGLMPPSYQSLATCMSTLVGEMWMEGELKIVPR